MEPKLKTKTGLLIMTNEAQNVIRHIHQDYSRANINQPLPLAFKNEENQIMVLNLPIYDYNLVALLAINSNHVFEFEVDGNTIIQTTYLN